MPPRYLRLLRPCAAALLLAAPLAASAADPAPTPAPVPVATRPDLSQYKSAEDLWQKYQSSYAPPYAKDWLATQWYLCDEIVRRFPDSPLVWEARASKAHLLTLSAKQGLPGLSAEECLSLYQALANDPHIPADAREGVRVDILVLLSHACPVETLAKEVRSYLHDYPDMTTNHLNEGVIRQARERLGSGDPEATQQIDKCLADIDAARVKGWPALVAAEKSKMESPRPDQSTPIKLSALPEFEGKPFDFKFTALDGTEVDGAKLRGKVVLIDYWATWCGPCMQEMPEVVAAYQKYHEHGLEVIGISLDQGDEAAIKAKLPRFTQDRGMAWPQACDGKGWQGELIKRFGVQGIPTHFLVNKQGVVLVDENPGGSLNEEVEKLLAE